MPNTAAGHAYPRTAATPDGHTQTTQNTSPADAVQALASDLTSHDRLPWIRPRTICRSQRTWLRGTVRRREPYRLVECCLSRRS